MFIVGIFVLALLLIVLDCVAYRKYIARDSRAWVRRLAIGAIVALNILPYIAVSMLWVFEMDNLVPMMWLLTIYTILSLSRMALYAGILPFKNNRLKWGVGISLCTIVAVVLTVGVVHTRKALTVRSVEIRSARLPEAFDGYRIAFFSDLHLASLTSAESMCANLVDRKRYKRSYDLSFTD